MKTRHLSLALILIVEFTGCCTKKTVSTNILPVPPQDSRSDRIALPLDSASLAKLEKALVSGLNPNNQTDNVGTTSNAIDVRLLHLLEKPASISDLSTPAFKELLPGTMVMQIVDARDPAAPPNQPVALFDGTYWWIFYPNAQHQLTAVMVVKLAALSSMTESHR